MPVFIDTAESHAPRVLKVTKSETVNESDQRVEVIELEMDMGNGSIAYPTLYLNHATKEADMNIIWSEGCRGNCWFICPSGEKQSLKRAYTARELQIQFDELAARIPEPIADWKIIPGGFGDGDVAQKESIDEVFAWIDELLTTTDVNIDRIALSTTLATEVLFRRIEEHASNHQNDERFRELCRFHISLFSGDNVLRQFLTGGSRKLDLVMPDVQRIAPILSHRVTCNVPLSNYTESDANMDTLIDLSQQYDNGNEHFLFKFSTTHKNPLEPTALDLPPLKPSDRPKFDECVERLQCRGLFAKIFLADSKESGCAQLTAIGKEALQHLTGVPQLPVLSSNQREVSPDVVKHIQERFLTV